MKRNRLEDFGRMMVLLENILKHELFTEDRMRAKYFPEWFETQTEDKRDDILRRFSYGIESLEEMISELILISRADDDLNSRPDGELW